MSFIEALMLKISLMQYRHARENGTQGKTGHKVYIYFISRLRDNYKRYLNEICGIGKSGSYIFRIYPLSCDREHCAVRRPQNIGLTMTLQIENYVNDVKRSQKRDIYIWVRMYITFHELRYDYSLIIDINFFILRYIVWLLLIKCRR